jgi:hypothetical protein
LQENGFPYAESTGAGRSGTDVTGTIGIDWEVKARRGFPVIETMEQLSERAKEGLVGIAVLRPDGWGPAKIADWPAIVPLSVIVKLLREVGYGDPIEGEK